MPEEEKWSDDLGTKASQEEVIIAISQRLGKDPEEITKVFRMAREARIIGKTPVGTIIDD